MSINGRLFMSLVMLGLFLAMVTMAVGYPSKAQLLPLVIGIPGSLLCLAQVAIEIAHAMGRPRDGAVEVPDEIDENGLPPKLAAIMDAPPDIDPATKTRRELALFGFVAGLMISILLIGFWPTIPLFMIAFLRGYEKESWKFTLSLTFAIWAGLYLLFDKLLGIIIHRGFLVEPFI